MVWLDQIMYHLDLPRKKYFAPLYLDSDPVMH